MSNPRVRPHLNFLPEDSGQHLSEVWQGEHWNRHMDPDLLTPMVRAHGQDFYVFEPTLAENGHVYMPHRWFKREGKIYAKAWPMAQASSRPGWVILEHGALDISIDELVLSFPQLVNGYKDRGFADPRIILGTSPLFQVHECFTNLSM